MSSDGLSLQPYATMPDLSLRKLRVEPLRLPEQLPGSQMGLSANVVKMPGPLPNQIPRGHIARVAGSGRERLRLQEFGFDRASDSLGDRILKGKRLRQFHLVAFGPDLVGRRGFHEL